MNMLSRNIARVFPWAYNLSTKHNHYLDYGWKDQLTFDDFHQMYKRNGLASAAVDKTIAKTWETIPALWESEKPAESDLEQAIRAWFAQRRIWQNLMTADRRSMVGEYAGAILLLADGKQLNQPVERVPGGIKGLHGILPAWQGQLSVAEWDNDTTSPTYGDPRMFQFSESRIANGSGLVREVSVHPDRVLIWSEDGTVNGSSALEPGFNDLIDAEKVKGAGGEGFWKSSRGALTIEAPEGMSFVDVQKAVGGNTADDVKDKLNERVDGFQSGFDKMLMLGGMQAKPLNIQLPQPEQFFNVPVMSFAASMQMPVRILIGNQTGERASTEDAREWAQTCMARRENICLPMLNELIRRLVQWSILPAKDWTVGWDSLLDASPAEKIDLASKMADINSKALPGDTPTFSPDEIREAAGYVSQDEVDFDWEGEDRDPEDSEPARTDLDIEDNQS